MHDTITVIGAAAAEPVLKTVHGEQVAELRIASTARRKRPGSEEWEDAYTNWYGVEAWGRLAANVAASVAKGDQLIVVGRLRVEQWESGERRGTSIRIRAEHVGHSMRFARTQRERIARDAHAAAGERQGAPEAREGRDEAAADAVPVAAGAEPQVAWASPGEPGQTPF
ncbi:single-stranded DNA-binding protein [Agrococcus sp. SL85]|uniref:single-stranded DNA-binding protein n=1 Tax=Agrococcus sp. SL85 TaxID=2995141 RepID=UPI00226CAD59|nr:single-stranded DNA-binding protein [Agrococcus sp. SL85]WAC65677.1 single-stranded DNA-binding protein [Agrococcus sp. SL85]